MSKSRIKVKLPTIATRDEAEAAMNELAVSANTLRYVISVRDGRVLEINDMFAPDIADHEQHIKERTDALRAWAEASPEQFPKGIKSLALTAGTLGFRTGTPKLALLSRAWNWEKVLAAAQRLIPAFIRSKPELDKEAILGQRDEEPLQYAIKACGMKVVQDESFFIEPKLTDTDARQTKAVK